MLDRKQLLLFVLLLLNSSIVWAETGPCPANALSVPFRILQGSKIVVPVFIDHTGPYDFTVDTGSEITVMDPELASELKLQSQGSISMAFFTNFARADLVKPDLVEAGQAALRDLVIAVAGLNQIRPLCRNLRGILGENFLSRFDLLIDYGRKMICLDQSNGLRTEIQGERIPVIEQPEQDGDLAYTVPTLVAVHIRGNGKKQTILRLDSGSSAPILSAQRIEPISWRQRNHARKGKVGGNGVSPVFAVMTRQDMQIGLHTTCTAAFLTPINAGRRAVRSGEDGLLPTILFERMFISRYEDRFVIFNPQRVDAFEAEVALSSRLIR